MARPSVLSGVKRGAAHYILYYYSIDILYICIYAGKRGLYQLKGGNPFDIAILDMQMPETNGLTLGKKIKENPDLADTLLVMLTAIGCRGDAARMKEIGLAAYLTKPIRQSQLYECLRIVAGRQTGEP